RPPLPLDTRPQQHPARTTPQLVPAGGGALAREAGFADVREVRAGDELAFGASRVAVVEADHDAGRGPRSRHRAEPVGYVVTGERSVYFAGDTDRFSGMAGIGEMGIDLGLIPVWGWGPKVGSGHLDPESAAEALTLLRPKVAVPIHWGTLFPLVMHRVRPDALHDPPKIFARCASRIAPQTKVEILDPGGRIELG
ncbi:MAG: MBL fold metallo-hydrolase, partial [Solirubrobacterales bacterium]